jgi:hypothetical protein
MDNLNIYKMSYVLDVNHFFLLLVVPSPFSESKSSTAYAALVEDHPQQETTRRTERCRRPKGLCARNILRGTYGTTLRVTISTMAVLSPKINIPIHQYDYVVYAICSMKWPNSTGLQILAGSFRLSREPIVFCRKIPVVFTFSVD